MKSGSIGVSICIDKGCRCEAILKKRNIDGVKIFINNKECKCKTTLNAVRELLNKIKFKGEVVIKNYFDVPISQGFATSSSGTLAALISIKNALSLDISYKCIANIAHRSEVVNKTGLGSVVTQYYGGVVVRKTPGGIDVCDVEKFEEEKFLIFFILGRGIVTKKALMHRDFSLGRILVKSFLKNPSLENYIKLSRKFIFEINVHEKSVMKFLKKNTEFTATLFGNVVYTITDEPERYLEKFDNKYIISKIYNFSLYAFS